MSSPASSPAKNLWKLALAAGLGLGSFWIGSGLTGPSDDDDVVGPASRTGIRHAMPAAMPVASWTGLQGEPAPARLAPEVLRNPFGPLNLRPPGSPSAAASQPAKPVEVKAVEAPPPPPPSAPPLPFTAIGSIEGSELTSGERLAFLQQQGALLIVRKGDAIGQLYRVETVSPDKVELTYLPLNQRQWLNLVP